jgi:hypothetical protein
MLSKKGKENNMSLKIKANSLLEPAVYPATLADIERHEGPTMKERRTLKIIIPLAAFLALAAGLGFRQWHAAHADTPGCQQYAPGASIAEGFGVPWDVFNTSIMEISATCSGANATIDMNATPNPSYQYRYVYNTGYYAQGGASSWTSFALTGSDLVSDAWLPHKGSALITLLDTTQTTYVIGYLGSWMGSEWKYGCRDSTCAQNYWQMQEVKEAAAPSPSPSPTPSETNPTPTPSSSSSANLVLSEGYESGTLDPNIWEGSEYSKSIQHPCQDRAKDGTWSLCAEYPGGSGGGNLQYWKLKGLKTREAYISLWMWLDPRTTTYGGHWFRWGGPCWAFDPSWNVDHGSVQFQPQMYPKVTDGSDGCPVVTGADYEKLFRRWDAPRKQLGDGQWHRIEIYVHNNTPGKSDGRMTWWLDGSVLLDLQDVALVEGDLMWTDAYIFFPSNTGSKPGEGGMANYDDLEFWDGCPTRNAFPYRPSCRSGGGSIPPAPPSNLRIK